jgi:CO/xanthine dehydrogenase Mo-binding subunit
LIKRILIGLPVLQLAGCVELGWRQAVAPVSPPPPGSFAPAATASKAVVKVEQLTVVVDAGTFVDPDGALAQVEGASLWGLSLALHEGAEFANGRVRDTNLDTYTPLRMRDVPPLDIEFIASSLPPSGLGEPATTVVGPAIGNAIFAAVGARLRHLPMRPADVLAALKAG